MRARRRQLGLSQQALGDALGLSYQQVQKYEQGISRIGAGRLQQLADVLNVPVSVFFDEKRGGSQDGDGVFASLNTPYSFRLVTAFAKMPDSRIQQTIVRLVEQVAERSGGPGASQVALSTP